MVSSPAIHTIRNYLSVVSKEGENTLNRKKVTPDITLSSIKVESKARAREKRRLLFISILSILCFLALWEAAVRFEWLNPKYVASPIQVVQAFIIKLSDPNPDGAVIGIHFITSIKLVFFGFALAVVVGVPLGLFMGYYKVIDKLVNPIFEIIRPIPPLAWIPITIVWMGIGTEAKSFIICLAAFVPCVINSHTGIRLTSPVLINVSKTFGASKWTIFRTVSIPSALPMVFAGIKIALGNAWTTLVAAELLAANAGLGYMIQQGRTLVRPDIIIVGMLTIGITGGVLSWLLNIAENRIVRGRAK